MPTPEQLALVYDLEGVVEKALKLFFVDKGIFAITTQQVPKTASAEENAANVALGYTLIDCQYQRPRVDISFTPGGGQGQFNNFVVDGVEMPLETAFTGQLKLDLITDTNVQTHAAYRTMMRYLIHTQLRSLNGNQLTTHKIQEYYRDGGTSPVMKSESGYFRSTIIFDLELTIQNDTFDNLT